LNDGDTFLNFSSVFYKITFDSGEPYGQIYFPDPTYHIGEIIYVVNVGNDYAPINNTGSDLLVPLNPDGSQITSLAFNDIDSNSYIFTAQNPSTPRWVLTGGIIS
jgi:hypothetical protein